MKLHLNTAPDLNIVRAYGAGQVTVGMQTYTSSLVISPHRIIPDWRPTTVIELTSEDLQRIEDLQPEIILLGTGNRLHFPSLRPADRAVGFEVMDTAAACRTYNILAGEGRNVAAALMIGMPPP
jgi:uncharacterized protein